LPLLPQFELALSLSLLLCTGQGPKFM